MKNTFLGWHKYGNYEVFGLFQKVSKNTWWFSGPGPNMSFQADLNSAKKASKEEIEKIIDFEEVPEVLH
jgi:hypothetical protein